MEKEEYYVTAHQITQDLNLQDKLKLLLRNSIRVPFRNIQHIDYAIARDHIVSVEQISSSLVRVRYFHPIADNSFPEEILFNEFDAIRKRGINEVKDFLQDVDPLNLQRVRLRKYRIRGFDIDVELFEERRYFSLRLSVDLKIQK